MFEPSLIIVSGASRGFGKACAIELANRFPSAEMHLLASSAERLASTKEALIEGRNNRRIVCHGIELSKLASGDASQAASLAKALSGAAVSERVLFVHSAACLGPTGAVEQLGFAKMAAVSQTVQVRRMTNRVGAPLTHGHAS